VALVYLHFCVYVGAYELAAELAAVDMEEEIDKTTMTSLETLVVAGVLLEFLAVSGGVAKAV
jgi:hypothetical protein